MADENNHIAFRGQVGVIPLGTRHFAIGLDWISFYEEGSIDKYARNQSKQHGANLYCTNKMYRNQIGFASTMAGHKNGMAVLAYHLMEEMGENFLASFQIDDKNYYVVAVRDGLVIPTTDVILSSDDAKYLHDNCQDTYRFEESIAPDSFLSEPTRIATLEEFARGPFKHRLEKSTTPLRQRHYLALGLLGALSLGGFYRHQGHLQSENDARMQEEASHRMKMNQALMEKRLQQERLFHVPPLPYYNHIHGMDMIQACEQQAMIYPHDAAGWVGDTIKCSDSTIQLEMKRDGGTVNWIAPTLNRPGFRPSVTPTGTGVSVSSPLNIRGLPVWSKTTETLKVEDVAFSLERNFEEVFQDIKVQSEKDVPFPVKVKRNNRNITENIFLYHVLDVDISTKVSPSSFQPVLAKIPSFIVTSMTLDLKSDTWDIKGKVFEKLNIPPEVEVAPDGPAQTIGTKGGKP